MPAADVRFPAVAGQFYPADPETLTRDLATYLAPVATEAEKFHDAIGCVVPHAGYMYSGHVAGAVYRRLPARSSYIILGPNHYGRGVPLAVMSHGTWRTPLGDVAIDQTLARSVCQACHLIEEDARAHEEEHSLEVQVPFLEASGEPFSMVPIAVGAGSYAPLEALGRGLAQAVRQAQQRVLIVASSDMNHYEPDGITRVKDRQAIERILALDPQGLYSVRRRENISMCGYGPVIALLTAAKELGATRAELVRYATSADAGGSRERVVGYAGVVIG
jgi:MEMO1 family protein